MTNKYFDKQKQQKALDWLEHQWLKSNRKCEICSSEEWSISEELIAPPILNHSVMLGGTTYPQFMIICNKCGNTKYINAVISGILKNEMPDEQ